MSHILAQLHAAEARVIDPPEPDFRTVDEIEIAQIKTNLFGLRAFREDAESDADMAAHHEALDHNDVLEAHRLRLAIWDAHADSEIALELRDGRDAVQAAHAAKRKFQRDEHALYPSRSAAINAPSPGGAVAERLSPKPRTGVDTEATGTPVAGNYSTDRRNAA